MKIDSEILIVGAGLMGSIAAIALHNQGFSVTLIDPKPLHEKVSDLRDPRTSALAEQVKVILEEYGIWENIKNDVGEINQIRITDNDSKLHLHFDNEVLNNVSLGYMIENNVMLSKLHNLIIANKINFINSSVQKIETNDFHSKIILNNEKILHSKLVLLADGKFSKLREMVGIKKKVKDYKQSAVIFLVEHEKPHDSIAQEKFYPAGPFAILPMKEQNISGIVWTEANQTAEALLKIDSERFHEFLSQKFGDYLGKVKVISEVFSYPLCLVYAEEYYKKRIALIGDALHSIHPIAGQGLNLSIRDFHKLIKILVNAKNLGLDYGLENILEKYQKECNFQDLSLIQITDILNSFFLVKSAPIASIRKLGLALVNNLSFLKQFFMEYAMGRK